MPTLDDLRKLDDGEFHGLCDDLLCRVEARYRRLRSHGINQDGVSIIGQPDSYVGETAAFCSIAFCYTVQRTGWWNKVVDDVKNSVAAAPDAAEIVIAIPHDADRDGPKQDIDWLGAARLAAGGAELRVVSAIKIIDALSIEIIDGNGSTTLSRSTGASSLLFLFLITSVGSRALRVRECGKDRQQLRELEAA